MCLGDKHVAPLLRYIPSPKACEIRKVASAEVTSTTRAAAFSIARCRGASLSMKCHCRKALGRAARECCNLEVTLFEHNHDPHPHLCESGFIMLHYAAPAVAKGAAIKYPACTCRLCPSISEGSQPSPKDFKRTSVYRRISIMVFQDGRCPP